MKIKYNSEEHHRRSIRVKGYDYTQPGAYFITICTHTMKSIFGRVVNGEMQLNECGIIVKNEWLKTGELRANAVLDEYIIMPNHFHGIVIITDDGRGVLQYAPTNNAFRSPSHTIGAIVRGFKSAVTKRINIIIGMSGMPVWQRNYYEHIIRNEKELNLIREYIINNPLQWQFDRENPERVLVGANGRSPYDKQWGHFEEVIYGKTK